MTDIKRRDYDNVTELTVTCGDCGGPLVAYGVIEAATGHYSIAAECEHCNKRIFVDLKFLGRMRFCSYEELKKWLNT